MMPAPGRIAPVLQPVSQQVVPYPIASWQEPVKEVAFTPTPRVKLQEPAVWLAPAPLPRAVLPLDPVVRLQSEPNPNAVLLKPVWNRFRAPFPVAVLPMAPAAAHCIAQAPIAVFPAPRLGLLEKPKLALDALSVHPLRIPAVVGVAAEVPPAAHLTPRAQAESAVRT